MIGMKKYLLFGLNAFLGVVVLFIHMYNISFRASAKDLIREQESVLNTIQTLSEKEPGLVNASQLLPLYEQKNQVQELLEKHEAAIRGNTTKFPYPIPLEFRDTLLKTQRAVKTQADDMGIKIPKDLGFEEYAGGGIPKDEDIPFLVRQLVSIKTVVDVLLDNKVVSVEKIRRYKLEEYTENSKGLYFETYFEFSFTCTYKVLIDVLNDLHKTQLFLVVKQMAYQLKHDDILEVTLKVAYVELFEGSE